MADREAYVDRYHVATYNPWGLKKGGAGGPLYLPPWQRELEIDGVTYEVSHYPVTIERRGHADEDIWAICKMGRCLKRNGKWEGERMPSSRTDKFKERTRFTLDEAWRLCEAEGILQ